MTPVIDAQNLYKCYPGFPPVLRGVNISVLPGEMVAIMGPSGCGKSTMLHVLGMLHAPDSGSLEVLNTDVFTLNREEVASFRRGNMGFVMQSSNLFDHSTVFENVEFPLIYENIPPEERWDRVVRALDLVRLSHRISYRSNRLSGGEQQRVAIARAMVNSPKILLADEPTGALDSRTSKVVMENFCDLAHEGRIAMVIVTHDPGVAEYCDSVYTLEDGVLVCHRKSPVPEPSGKNSLLHTTEKKLNGVCIVDNFPTPYGTAQTQSVLNLHEAQLLTRIYSLQGTKLSHLVGGDYTLPVPTKRQSKLSTIKYALKLLTKGGIARAYWKQMPSKQRFSPLRYLQNLNNFAKGLRLTQWCAEDGTEHMHAIDAHNTATAAWVTSGISGIPFSFTLRTRDMRDLPFVALKACHAAFVRCDTQATRNLLLEACYKLDPSFNQEKIQCVYDSPGIWPNSEDFDIPPMARQGCIRILTAGHLTAHKGLKNIFKACKKLKADNIPFELTVAGSGPSIWKLRWLSIRMGIKKHVTFLGHIPHEHMPELLRKSHIFVADSTTLRNGEHDGIPASLMEAMVFGVPVVASNLEGHMEILEHEKTALLFPENDVESLALALERLARYPEKAHALSSAARIRALELFSPQKQGERMEGLVLQGKHK